MGTRREAGTPCTEDGWNYALFNEPEGLCDSKWYLTLGGALASLLVAQLQTKAYHRTIGIPRVRARTPVRNSAITP